MPRCRLGDIWASTASGRARQAKVSSRRRAPHKACFKSVSGWMLESVGREHAFPDWAQFRNLELLTDHCRAQSAESQFGGTLPRTFW